MSPLPAPTESALRRALARAERGVALDAVEAETLLHARGLGEGEPLDRLLTAAGRVRDAGLASAGRPGRGHLQPQGVHPAHPPVPRPLPLLHVRDRRPGSCARRARRRSSPRTRCSTSPAPGRRWAARRRCSPSATAPRTAGRVAAEWLDAHGYDSTLAYLRAMAIRVLEETGLLPHLNPGRADLGGDPAAQAGRRRRWG